MGEFVLEPTIYYFQPEALFEQIEPPIDTWYPVFHELKCRVLYWLMRHTYSENRKIDTRVTIDGQVYSKTSTDYANNDDFWIGFYVVNRVRTLTNSTAERTVEMWDKWLHGRDVLFEIRSRETFGVGGAKINCWTSWQGEEA